MRSHWFHVAFDFRLFTEIPSALSKFRAFGSVAVSQLPSNAAFNAQVKLVADRLDSIISSMDTTLQFLGQIEYMGHSHKPRGVGRQEFTVISYCNLLLKSIKSYNFPHGTEIRSFPVGLPCFQGCFW